MNRELTETLENCFKNLAYPTYLNTVGLEEKNVSALALQSTNLSIANGIPNYMHLAMVNFIMATDDKFYVARQENEAVITSAIEYSNKLAISLRYKKDSGLFEVNSKSNETANSIQEELDTLWLSAIVLAISASNQMLFEDFRKIVNFINPNYLVSLANSELKKKTAERNEQLPTLYVNFIGKVLDELLSVNEVLVHDSSNNLRLRNLSEQLLSSSNDFSGLSVFGGTDSCGVIDSDLIDSDLFYVFNVKDKKTTETEKTKVKAKANFILSANRVFSEEEQAMMINTSFRLENYRPIDLSVDLVEAFYATTQAGMPLVASFLYGPSGTGKTELVQYLGDKLGLPVTTFQCTANTDESDLIGKPKSLGIKMTGENDEISYTDTPLTKAIKKGWIIEIQEIASIKEAAVVQIFNSLLDGTRSLMLPNGEALNIHPDFRIVFTSNVSYEGCQLLNQSFISRCQFVSNVQMPPKKELVSRLISQVGWTGNKEIPNIIVECVAKINAELKESCLEDGSCDFRAAKDWLQMHKDTNWSLLKCARYTIISKATLETEKHDDLIGILKTYLPGD